MKGRGPHEISWPAGPKTATFSGISDGTAVALLRGGHDARRRTKEITMTTNAVADEGLSAFLTVRPRLLGIARRMLGCGAAAEDIVQEVWVRWQATDHGVVRDPAAFLAATATRLAINVIQSARARREKYLDVMLPEPADTGMSPALTVELGDALHDGLLVLVQTLSPTERTAFILREAFEYAYRDIGAALRLQEANARQVVTRARQRLANRRRTPAITRHNEWLYPVNGS
jgi:RNA polymerase sigma factor (sigma-70 family)